MNKFLELCFANHAGNDEEIYNKVDEIMQPLRDELESWVCPEICDEMNDVISDCVAKVCNYSGGKGMELALGVVDGTIKQVIH